EFSQHQLPSLQPRRERLREAGELGYGPDDGVRTRGRVSSAASRITRLAASSRTDAGGGIRPARRHDHIFTPCSAKYFTPPGRHGIGELFRRWFSDVLVFPSAC